MDIKTALEAVVSGQHLSSMEMRDVMRQIMTGHATEAQIGAFLVALRIKGETIDEIAGAVEVMRDLATGVEVSGDYLVEMSPIYLMSPLRRLLWSRPLVGA